jgi:glycine dehydrogenase subunit 2
MNFRQAYWNEPLLQEKASGPDEDVSLADLVPAKLRRESLKIPNLAEHDVVRHFTRLSQMNFGIDTGFYPLGSCTMKFNPKFTEELAGLPTVTRLHPDQDETTVQGALRLLYELQGLLAKISGMDAVTLQPAAGAHGEFTGLLLAQAYHRDRGEERHQVILPDTAHGTNFASAGMLGFDLIEIPSKDGRVDLGALEAAAGEKTLALMLTNPNTLGIFEEHVLDIARIVHDAGGLLYYDGANFNAILGRTSPGKMDFDIVHFNLHKTFTTPHGGGGPGAGPVGVRKALEPFLPTPVVGLNGRGYHLDYDRPKSIGKVRAWYGNFALLVRAYAYILRMGGNGLREVSERAVLNANYVRHRLQGVLDVPFGGLRKHEFVASAAKLAGKGVRAVDLAKRLMDFGYHPPTVYFPHLVEEALMIEPTETETKETLDGFVDALTKIVNEDPAVLHSAPHNTAVGRVDEVQAAREPILSWRMTKSRTTPRSQLDVVPIEGP